METIEIPCYDENGFEIGAENVSYQYDGIDNVYFISIFPLRAETCDVKDILVDFLKSYHGNSINVNFNI